MAEERIKLADKEVPIKFLNYGDKMECDVIAETKDGYKQYLFIKEAQYRMVEGFPTLEAARKFIDSLSLADGKKLKEACIRIINKGADAAKK